MASITTCFRGLWRVNVFLAPIFLPFLWALWRISNEIYMSAYVLCVLIISQILSVGLMVAMAKMIDVLKYKHPLFSQEITGRSCIMGAIVSTLLITIWGNIFFDNLFQFKQGNYGSCLSPILTILPHCLICFAVGGREQCLDKVRQQTG